jgi:hypothetical protein
VCVCAWGGGGVFLSVDDLNDHSRDSIARLCASFERNFALKDKKSFSESLQENETVRCAVCLPYFTRLSE